MMIDELSFQIIGAAMTVHTVFGPGLKEKPYDECFGDQLSRLGLQFDRQVQFPVVSHGRRLQSTFRVDYVVKKAVIVEIKAVPSIHPVHVAQLRSYLKMSGVSLGLIINFNVVHLRDGSNASSTAMFQTPRSNTLCASALCVLCSLCVLVGVVLTLR